MNLSSPFYDNSNNNYDNTTPTPTPTPTLPLTILSRSLSENDVDIAHHHHHHHHLETTATPYKEHEEDNHNQKHKQIITNHPVNNADNIFQKRQQPHHHHHHHHEQQQHRYHHQADSDTDEHQHHHHHPSSTSTDLPLLLPPALCSSSPSQRTKEQMIELCERFAFHTPRCVFEDLANFYQQQQQQQQQQHYTCDDHDHDHDRDEGSLSSLSDDGGQRIMAAKGTTITERKTTTNDNNNDHDDSSSASSEQLISTSTSLLGNAMPYHVQRDCALIFVDISGFTKLSTMLDVESLSKVINSYFEMMVDEVVRHGGDILKFAGDAFFAEWRVVQNSDENLKKRRMITSTATATASQYHHNPLLNLRERILGVDRTFDHRSLSHCVLAAAQCTASMVAKYSDFYIQTSSSRENSSSISFGKTDAMLNVHCGLGVGTLTGLHVGVQDRREFLFLGDPINQVAAATDAASDGEVFASVEAMEYLGGVCQLSTTPQEAIIRNNINNVTTTATCIASRNQTFFQPLTATKIDNNNTSPRHILPASRSLLSSSSSSSNRTPGEHNSSENNSKNMMDEREIVKLYRQLSLYVHPVARESRIVEASNLQHESSTKKKTRQQQDESTQQNLYRADAELRTVFTIFIKAVMCTQIKGDTESDQATYERLNSVFMVTCRELHKTGGQLRQFIVDDKGVVLIATFGLRGSTFPNMITNHALPSIFAIHSSLKSELHVENRIGATFGKVYCGVVGGIQRHEFAVMGAPVNLAARLMCSPKNNGILVDEAVHAQADARFVFKSLPPVKAKGYEKPVIIFEPLRAVTSKKRSAVHGFIGRQPDLEELSEMAKKIITGTTPAPTVMAFIIGEPGMGKSTLGICVGEEMKRFAAIHQKKIIFVRSTSTETQKRIPLRSFRQIFLGSIRELCLHDGTLHVSQDVRSSQKRRRRNSMEPVTTYSIRPPRSLHKGSYPSSMKSSSTSATKQNDIQDYGNPNYLVNVPYLKKLRDICEELKFPLGFADLVGSQLLGLDGAVPTTYVEEYIPSIEEVVDFLTAAYIRITNFSDLIMIFLDDFQWIDSLTWKVIRVLCDKGKNIMLMGAMRSGETQALRRMSSVTSWHGDMQSRRGIVEVSLGPLELNDVRALASKVFEIDTSLIDEAVYNDIFQRSGGLPIYVVQLLESIKRNKTVEINKETRMLRWTKEAESEQKRIGPNSVTAVELPLLNRLDALDISIRKTLQTCAVLGMSFSLSDVLRVHPEIEELVIIATLNAAVDELILIEDIDDEEDAVQSTEETQTGLHSAFHHEWVPDDDRYFEFSHAMWRKCVLDTMLNEQKIHLHRAVAEAIEKEHIFVMESSDIGRLLTLFEHWKLCGDFGKAAPLALAVGLRLEEWDLSIQCLDLYRDTLEMCYESAGSSSEAAELSYEDNGIWLSASAPPATVKFILLLHIRLAQCHLRLGEEEQCAIMYEDAFKIMTLSPRVARLNHSLILPIIAGLCTIAELRGLSDGSSLLDNGDLIEQFLIEAKKHKGPVHICRALAMKASFFAKLGEFEDAVAVLEELERIYKTPQHSALLKEEYGKDYAAQTCADSIEWYAIMSIDLSTAIEQCEWLMENILPNFDLRDGVDTVMALIFPVILVLKSSGRAIEAESILFNKVINPYHDVREKTIPTPWVKLFNPIAYLLDIIKMEESPSHLDTYSLSEMEEWVLDAENSIFPLDLQLRGYALIGEICYRLVRLKDASEESQQESDQDQQFEVLLERGRIALTRVVSSRHEDLSGAYLINHARNILESLMELGENRERQVAPAQGNNVEILPPQAQLVEEYNATDPIDTIQAKCCNIL